jgi:hypothetical protein
MDACLQVSVDAGKQSVREMRPCTLILDSNTAVVLDCGTHVFLWLGANIELPENLHHAIRHRSLVALLNPQKFLKSSMHVCEWRMHAQLDGCQCQN